ncbi:hypothetical protein A4U53_004145 (plasmid) [Rhizobium ruizarguesonis]|uniref:Uncharacterized protein n=2 Tax=Rhizobium TaxID=379 RepID=A0A179C082_RHILE|nr:hypothetical protein [Rhizobium leguminosarum]OAP96841.1 hypothetical protein A4U53_37400 [Rhizobium leguminosarum]
MTKQLFDVHVERVNENANQQPEFDMRAVAITITEDGQLSIQGEGGKSRTLSAWGSVTITRVWGSE